MCDAVAFPAVLPCGEDLQVGFAMESTDGASLDRVDVINLVDDTSRFSESCGFGIEGPDRLGVGPRWHRLLFCCPSFQTSGGNDIWIQAAPLAASFGVDGLSALAQRLNAFLVRLSVYVVALAPFLFMSRIVRLTVRGLGFYVRGCVRFVLSPKFFAINIAILLLTNQLLLWMCHAPRRSLAAYFVAIGYSIGSVFRTSLFWVCGVPRISQFAFTRPMGCAVGLLVGLFIKRHDASIVYQMGAA